MSGLKCAASAPQSGGRGPQFPDLWQASRNLDHAEVSTGSLVDGRVDELGLPGREFLHLESGPVDAIGRAPNLIRTVDWTTEAHPEANGSVFECNHLMGKYEVVGKLSRDRLRVTEREVYRVLRAGQGP